MHIFVAVFICSRIPFVCLLNDLTEVYSYLWMTVYIEDRNAFIGKANSKWLYNLKMEFCHTQSLVRNYICIYLNYDIKMGNFH